MMMAENGGFPVFSGARPFSFGGAPEVFPAVPIFTKTAPFLSGGYHEYFFVTPISSAVAPIDSGVVPILSESAPFYFGVSPKGGRVAAGASRWFLEDGPQVWSLPIKVQNTQTPISCARLPGEQSILIPAEATRSTTPIFAGGPPAMPLKTATLALCLTRLPAVPQPPDLNPK